VCGWKKIQIGEYLAEIQARAWLSHALCAPGQHTVETRRDVRTADPSADGRRSAAIFATVEMPSVRGVSSRRPRHDTLLDRPIPAIKEEIKRSSVRRQWPYQVVITTPAIAAVRPRDCGALQRWLAMLMIVDRRARYTTALTLAANDQYVSKSTMRFFLKHHTIHACRN